MKKGILKIQTSENVLAHEVKLCRGFFDRLRGLLGTSTLAEDEACWLLPCNSVHTIGMRYPIDVYFLNKDNEIVSMIENMAPNRFSPIMWNAHSVLEFSAKGGSASGGKSGSKRNLKVGDKVEYFS